MGTWLPSPLVTGLPGAPSPEDEAVRRDSFSLDFMILLEWRPSPGA